MIPARGLVDVQGAGWLSLVRAKGDQGSDGPVTVAQVSPQGVVVVATQRARALHVG